MRLRQPDGCDRQAAARIIGIGRAVGLLEAVMFDDPVDAGNVVAGWILPGFNGEGNARLVVADIAKDGFARRGAGFKGSQLPGIVSLSESAGWQEPAILRRKGRRRK